MDELESMTVPAFDLPAEALLRTPQQDAGPAGQPQYPPSGFSGSLGDPTGLTPKHPSAQGAPQPPSPTLAGTGLEGLTFSPETLGEQAWTVPLSLSCACVHAR